MPILTGTSVFGFQQVNTLPVNANRFVNLWPQFAEPRNRNQRVGSLIIAFQTPPGDWAVVDARQLYAPGLAIVPRPIAVAGTLTVWVDWFVAGYRWRCGTND